MLSVNIRQVLEEIGHQVVDGVKHEIRTKRLTKYGSVNASGNLADSVELVHTDNGIEILIADYAFKLVYGTPPGTMVDKGRLEQWIQDKGIQSNIPVGQLASLIQYKIFTKGTTIWEEYRGMPSGLFEDTLNGELEREIEEQVGNLYLVDFDSQILATFHI